MEQEEEYIANRLLKRLEVLKREKQARLPPDVLVSSSWQWSVVTVLRRGI